MHLCPAILLSTATDSLEDLNLVVRHQTFHFGFKKDAIAASHNERSWQCNVAESCTIRTTPRTSQRFECRKDTSRLRCQFHTIFDKPKGLCYSRYL